MKQLSFQYHLKIEMDARVSAHHFTLRCLPQTDARQQIEDLNYRISPSDFISSSTDHWKNCLLYGACFGEHTLFDVRLSGRAITGLSDSIDGPTGTSAYVFSRHTPLTNTTPPLTEAAARLCGNSDLEIAESAMSLVHNSITYAPSSTVFQTGAAEAFALGRGVCQDYAHIMLTLLRSRGIPCRYVTGLLLGEGASHAWVEVLHEGRWYALDPTNNVFVTDQHIKIAHGRDAQDCAMNRGIFHGYANQKTTITVIVTE